MVWSSGFLPNAGIGFLHHLLAEIDADQVVLENVVVEHVFGCFAEVHDPLGHVRRANAEGHVLRIGGAGRVIVAADPTNPASDEVGIARVFALHEDAIATKYRGRAVTFGHFAVIESIFVKMPRLPTIRVIGSQFISTRLLGFLSTPGIASVIVAHFLTLRFF